jgi:hypothetical protein
MNVTCGIESVYRALSGNLRTVPPFPRALPWAVIPTALQADDSGADFD